MENITTVQAFSSFRLLLLKFFPSSLSQNALLLRRKKKKTTPNPVLLNAQIGNQNHKPGSEREQVLQFPVLPEDLQPHDGFIIFIFLQ